MRAPGEVEDALARLAPLEGDPVVDAAIACLRWVLRRGEWREVWSELEARHGRPEPPSPPGATDPAP